MSSPGTPGLGLCDRNVEALDGLGVLGANVDVAVVRADRECPDHHPLEHRVRVALEDRAVHESAGVPLVGVADDELPVPFGEACEPPLHPGQEARTAAAAQARVHNGGDQRVGVVLLEDLPERRVAVGRQVVLQRLGVDLAAVAQHDAGLVGEVRALGAAPVVGPHQPFLDRLPLDDVLGEELLDLVGGDVAVLDPAAIVAADLDQRLAVTHPDAPRLLEVEGGGAGRPALFERLVRLLRAGRDAARPEPDQDFHH
jgi:hypothetical protein